ncbi:arsenic resistance N-acetyltransferase ArsN2 [Chitinilyticum piscinae]|nr:arsenic resistance N-acetyltransferase ArsN2 [Chitinilyticum piscinae]
MQVEVVREHEKRAQIRGLLQAEGLVVADLDEAALTLWALQEQGQVIAAAGLEALADVQLLRSLVVGDHWRGRGFAVMLLAVLEEQARQRGARELWLLTSSAEGYFRRHGYRPVLRDRVPAALAASRQFASLCPASAVCMCKTLTFETN